MTTGGKCMWAKGVLMELGYTMRNAEQDDTFHSLCI